MQQPAIGIIGGSGLYQIEGLSDPSEHTIDTPFGAPSDVIFGGTLAGRQVFFLPRHGRGHRILPHELNHRANIWALRSLGVRWIVCVTAVGSLQEKYAPRSIVLPSSSSTGRARRSGTRFLEMESSRTPASPIRSAPVFKICSTRQAPASALRCTKAAPM